MSSTNLDHLANHRHVTITSERLGATFTMRRVNGADKIKIGRRHVEIARRIAGCAPDDLNFEGQSMTYACAVLEAVVEEPRGFDYLGSDDPEAVVDLLMAYEAWRKSFYLSLAEKPRIIGPPGDADDRPGLPEDPGLRPEGSALPGE